MPPVASVLAFAVASVILIVIPGPSVLFTVGRALAYGRRTALATVCGNAAGNYLVASAWRSAWARWSSARPRCSWPSGWPEPFI